jgi:NAD-dependent deacetylase
MKEVRCFVKVVSKNDQRYLEEAAGVLLDAKFPVALTGAGLSVGSGIPDFRSPGGLWSVYPPDEYATLEVFYRNPEKAWELYRALGNTLENKKANRAHQALAELERGGVVRGIVTQNIDGLHQQAGSETVYEIHGDHQNLQCLECRHFVPVEDDHYRSAAVPRCPHCRYPLKPNVVLFGEAVRDYDRIELFLSRCDLLLVAGTSAQVYPAAEIPLRIRQRGGLVFEFNREAALGVDRYSGISTITDYFFHGDVLDTLPMLVTATGSRHE